MMHFLSLKPSASRPKFGNALCKFDTFNQNKTIVMTMESIWILKCSEEKNTVKIQYLNSVNLEKILLFYAFWDIFIF